MKTFSSKVQAATDTISDLPRQLLAVRRYLRMGAAAVETQWSWSHAQAHAFNKGPQGVQVQASINKVKVAFEAANPGYTLSASPIRELERQISKWNSNKNVGEIAESLSKTVYAELQSYPDNADAASLTKFCKFLKGAELKKETPLAAPGTSDHGQMKAVDFVVVQNGNTIAGVSSTKATLEWDKPGWTEKLRLAVAKSAAGFSAQHLMKPYEPWHYNLLSAAAH